MTSVVLQPVAQALAEGLVVVTHNVRLDAYGVELLETWREVTDRRNE